MIKFRLYYDKDAETVWLNEMAENGWAMKRFFAGFYSFEKCEPGQYIYQIDFGNRLYRVTDEYREFMEETGIEIVQTWGFWIILRKLASQGKFELYTDVDSSIEHYSKIRRMFKVVTIVELICLLMEVIAGANGAYFGYAFALLLGAILFGLVNAVIKTNNVIAGLQERKGGAVSEKYKRCISPLLPCGLLLNGCALIIDESVSEGITMTIQIIAIVLMLIGIYKTARNRSGRE